METPARNSAISLCLSIFLALPLLALPLLAQQTIPLYPDRPVDPAAPPEKIVDRSPGSGVPDRAISNVQQPTVTVYLPPKEKANGTAMLICPGGGFVRLAIDQEGHDVARWLNTLGFAAVVLKYRLPGDGAGLRTETDLHKLADLHRVDLEDAETALRLVRANAARWNLKPGAIGMMGFSAGGRLAALQTMVAPSDARPDFLVLAYPGIPATLSLTGSAPPTFLAAAADDTTADPVQNAVRFFTALRAAKVPAELHIYSSGGHGFGIAKTGKPSDAWTGALLAWLKQLHLD